MKTQAPGFTLGRDWYWRVMSHDDPRFDGEGQAPGSFEAGQKAEYHVQDREVELGVKRPADLKAWGGKIH